MSESSFVHIKVKSDEAVYSKKQLLLGQIDTINLQNRLGKYKRLRKKEFSLRNKLRSEIKALNTLINRTDNFMPDVAKKEREQIKKHVKAVKKRTKTEKDLNEIHKRLEKLELI